MVNPLYPWIQNMAIYIWFSSRPQPAKIYRKTDELSDDELMSPRTCLDRTADPFAGSTCLALEPAGGRATPCGSGPIRGGLGGLHGSMAGLTWGPGPEQP